MEAEMKTQKILGTAVVMACVAFAGAAAANDVCQAKNGYIGGGVGSSATDTTWGAIADANGFFYGKRKISGDCPVKDWLFDGKGPPKFKNFPVANSNGITRDQCGLYNMVAQLHWSLEQGENGKSYLAAQEIVRDVNKLTAEGGLDATKGAQIRTAATAVEQCIYLLLAPN